MYIGPVNEILVESLMPRGLPGLRHGSIHGESLDKENAC